MVESNKNAECKHSVNLKQVTCQLSTECYCEKTGRNKTL